MHNQTQNIVTYLESENVPTVNLSAFKCKENKKKIIKDLGNVANKINEINKVDKPKIESEIIIDDTPDKSEVIIDGNIERRVRPLNLSFMNKKQKDVTWL